MADYSNLLGTLPNVGLPAWQSSAAPANPNILAQILAPQQDPGAMQPQQSTAPIAPPDDAAPRKRLSALDIIGSLADSIAVAGGHPAAYQAGLDANLARQQAAQDRPQQLQLQDLQRQHIQQEIATGQTGVDKTTNEVNAGRYGAALRGLQAVAKANPNADLASTWAAFARQNQIPDADAQALFGIIQQNPGAIDGLASQYEKHSSGGSEKYGNNPQVIFNPATGESQLVQTSDAGNSHIVTLPAGFRPAPNLMSVDQGGNVQLVDRRSNGLPQRIIPKSVAPNTTATIAAEGQRQQAGFTHADAAAAAKNGGKTDPSNALALLDNISNGFDDLHSMGALAGQGNVLTGAIGRSALGSRIAAQAGDAAAQKRLEIAKNTSLLQQEMIKSLPASATRTKFEQEIARQALPDPSTMTLSTAKAIIAQSKAAYLRAVQASNAAGSPARPVLTAKPPVASSGWGTVIRH